MQTDKEKSDKDKNSDSEKVELDKEKKLSLMKKLKKTLKRVKKEDPNIYPLF